MFNWATVHTIEEPPEKRKTNGYLTDEDWKPHKHLILTLVYEKKWRLPRVIEYMSNKKGFHANVRQYTNALEKWGWGRRSQYISLSSAQIAYVLDEVEKRHKAGKESNFRYTEKRGGEKISFLRMLKFLRFKTDQMQAESAEKKQEVSNKLAAGLSSQGISVYTPTITSGARKKRVKVGPTSTLGVVHEQDKAPSPRLKANNNQNRDTSKLATYGYVQLDRLVPPQDYGHIFTIDRAALRQSQELNDLNDPSSDNISNAVAFVMDANQRPPTVEVCAISPATQALQYPSQSTSSNNTSGEEPTSVMAAYINMNTTPEGIVDSIQNIFDEMIEIDSQQVALNLGLGETVSQKLESALADAVLQSQHRGEHLFCPKNTTLLKLEIDILESRYTAVHEGFQQEVVLWNAILDNIRRSMYPIRIDGQQVDPAYKLSLLTEAAWMFLFRRQWGACLRMSELIDEVSDTTQTSLKIANKLRMSLCFEAVENYHRAFEAIEVAKTLVLHLKPDDADAAMAFILIQEKLYRIHIFFKLYGSQQVFSTYPVLDEIRSMYSICRAENIPTRALIQKLEMLGLSWEVLDDLHKSTREYVSSTFASTFAKFRPSWEYHPIFCMPMRNALTWVLSQSKDEYPYLDKPQLVSDGEMWSAQLINSLAKAAKSRDELDWHLLAFVQFFGTNLIDSYNLFSQAAAIFERLFYCLLTLSPTLITIWGVGEEIPCLFRIAIVMNLGSSGGKG